MNARTPGLIAALCVAAFVTWLAVGEQGATTGAGASSDSAAGFGALGRTGPSGDHLPAQEPGGCEALVRWSVVEVDSRFGLDPAEARSAVEEAVSLWEEAAGRQLFQADSTNGLPIRFVYDARQARANERVRLEQAFEDRDRALEDRRDALERDRDRHLEDGARYKERARDFEGALVRHNQRVRAWNEAGARPGDAATDLRDAEEALERTQAELEAKLRELRAREEHIRAEAAELDDALAERNRQADRLERDFPLTRVESGAYREVVRQDASGRASIGPEIRVFLFVTRQDLIGVLAHELGHALGLDHAEAPPAVMSAEHERKSGTRRQVTVTPADVELLRTRCP